MLLSVLHNGRKKNRMYVRVWECVCVFCVCGGSNLFSHYWLCETQAHTHTHLEYFGFFASPSPSPLGYRAPPQP